MDNQHSMDTTWRRVAAVLYKKPTDSKIFGSVELDVTDLEKYISQKRSEGLKITYTHVFLLAVARAIRDEVPEFNTYIKRGNVVVRPSIDASLSVLIKGDSEMGSVKVVKADQFTLQELANYLDAEIAKSRTGQVNNAERMKDVLAAMPWPIRGWVLAIIKQLTVNWGMSISSIGLSANSFGTYVISNIGSIGLDMGYPALLPSANVSVVFTMGSVNTKPAVFEGQIVPRRLMNLGAALDHRIVDAIHGGRMFKYLKMIVKNPHLLEKH